MRNSEASIHPPSDRPVRVLIVDDDHGVTVVCRRLLAYAGGYEVRTEHTASAALAAARACPPDLILLDLHLPDCAGDDLLAEFRADPALADTSVLLLTGDPSRHVVRGHDALSGCPVLLKPIDPGYFSQVISVHLRHHQAA